MWFWVVEKRRQSAKSRDESGIGPGGRIRTPPDKGQDRAAARLGYRVPTGARLELARPRQHLAKMNKVLDGSKEAATHSIDFLFSCCSK